MKLRPPSVLRIERERARARVREKGRTENTHLLWKAGKAGLQDPVL